MPRAKNNTAAKKAESTPEIEVAVAVVQEPTPEPIPAPAPAKEKQVDMNMYIPVINGSHGKLVYISRHTNEKFVWDEFGAEQDMQLLELKSAKSSAKDFFINNWFMFKPEDAWVINYLGLDQYYKNAIGIDGFDNLFASSPAAIKSRIAKLSAGQKDSVAVRARQLMADGEIDSNKVIKALEESLGINLTDK